MQELSETPLPKPIKSSQKPLQAKDKVKGKMVEPKKPLKRKDQIIMDAEVAKNLEAQMQAEMEEEEKLVEGSEKEVKGNKKAKESSSKRAGSNLEQEDAKRQRLDEENESIELKRCLEKVPKDDDDVTTKDLLNHQPLLITDLQRREKKLFQDHLCRCIVKEIFKKTKPVDDMENLLFQTLKTMFEHQVEMAYDLLRLIKRQINKGYVPDEDKAFNQETSRFRRKFKKYLSDNEESLGENASKQGGLMMQMQRLPSFMRLQMMLETRTTRFQTAK
nr:hypothetical protein [Tanacetum cinerariifolium]